MSMMKNAENINADNKERNAKNFGRDKFILFYMKGMDE